MQFGRDAGEASDPSRAARQFGIRSGLWKVRDGAPVDRFDMVLLREVSRERIMWWGSADPRLSLREIARRLGVHVGAVSAHLRAWQRCGFLRGYAAVPNPSLLGAHLAGGALRVDEARSKPQVLSDLALVEGAAFAVDQVGPWIVVMFVHRSRQALDRCTRLVRRLAGVEEMEPCLPFRSPVATLSPSPLDWRILGAVNASPKGSIEKLARAVGVSSKTLARRYDRLIRADAVWSIPLLDFSKYSGATLARFIVRTDDSLEPARFLRSIEDRFPSHILLEDHSGLPVLDPPLTGGLFMLLIQLGSVADAEEAEVAIRDLPGVDGVEVFFPKRLYVFDHWFPEV
jgi:DNA-binding Lrp family transcriptional regulator